MNLTLHGIPTCGTVKKARKWLDARSIPYTFVDFRSSPPSREQVARWVEHFGARALRNTSGGAYRALGPEKKTWDDARWLEAFLADPMLIKRPVVEIDGAPALVGFKEPLWLERVASEEQA